MNDEWNPVFVTIVLTIAILICASKVFYHSYSGLFSHFLETAYAAFLWIRFYLVIAIIIVVLGGIAFSGLRYHLEIANERKEKECRLTTQISSLKADIEHLNDRLTKASEKIKEIKRPLEIDLVMISEEIFSSFDTPKKEENP